MMRSTLVRCASVALATFSLACSDSTAPVNLNQEQVGDMLDAMSAVSSFGSTGAPGTAALRVGPQATANATLNVSETASCPNGGSASVSGTVSDGTAAGSMTMHVTQSFSGCAATSEKGRVWTFNGDPNIVTDVSTSYNQTTGAYSMTATQVGGIRFSSDLGSGSCQVNLTFTLTGNQTSFAGTLSGTACGVSIQKTVSLTQ